MTRYRYVGIVTNVMELKAARTHQKLTQEQLAEMSGIPQTTISDIERGVIKKPSWDAVARLASALGVEPHDLFPIGDSEAVA